jgi:peptidoglycan/xylan/chitin deacetylase (PgdA/CDA1 family)
MYLTNHDPFYESERVESPSKKFYLKSRSIFVCLLFVVGFLGFANIANAATYYVSPLGSNTSPYDTWEKAANLPSTALTAGNTDVGGDGPHIMYIAPGTYSDSLSITDVDWASGQIIGTAVNGSITDAEKGQVIITKDTAHTLRCSSSGVSIKNLSFTGTDATHSTIYVDGPNFTGTNLYAYDSGQYLIVTTTGATDFRFHKSLFSGSISIGILIDANSSGMIQSSVLTNSGNRNAGATIALKLNSTGAVTIDNSLIQGSGRYAISQTGVGITQVNNSALMSGDDQTTTSAAVTQSAGTINVDHSVVIANWRQIAGGSNAAYFIGTVGDTNNVKTNNPRFVRHQRSGFIIPCVDDAASISYATTTLEPVLSALGIKGTMYAESVSATMGTYLTDLLSMQSRGVIEVQSHGYNHTDLTTVGDLTATTEELTNARNSFQSQMGYLPAHLATPFGTNNSTVESASKAAGYTSSRVGLGGSSWRLSSINVFQTSYVGSGTMVGSTDADTIAITRALGEQVAQKGEIVFILGHNDAEISADNWRLILSTLQDEYPEITITSASEALTEITALPWTTADDITYARTWSDQSNYNLQPLSPAIDSGTSIDGFTTSTTTDYAGNPIYGTPDIGAYEYQPPFTIGTDDLDVTGDIRIYGDWKYRYTTATSSTMSANFSVAPPEGTWTYSASTTRPEWLNISDITWNTSGTYSKEWTASSTSATTTVYTIGDLQPSTQYTVRVDSATSTNITGDSCTGSICESDGDGQIIFTYSGGYSEHDFNIDPASIPTLTTNSPSAITTTSATANGNIDGIGDDSPTTRGFLYGTDSTLVTVIATTTETGTFGTGVFTASLSGFTCGNTYYIRSYATNSGGIGYGSIVSFTTSACPSSSSGSRSIYYVPPVQNVATTTTATSTQLIITRPFSRDLELGMSGDDVKELQRFLNNKGFTIAHSGFGSLGNETNTFGSLTKQALIKFQTFYNITPAIGYFGPLTRAFVNGTQASSTTSVSTTTSAFTRNLSYGSTGEDVKQLQTFLNTHGYIVSASGPGSRGNETTMFGQATQSTLIKFQIANNITPAVGFFGPVTRKVVDGMK